MNTWVGATDTDWGATPGAASANWSTGFVPTIADDVTINSSAPGNVTLSGDIEFKSLLFTGFTGTFDMGNFDARFAGNVTANSPPNGILNSGVWKTAVTCSVDFRHNTIKALQIDSAGTPAVVTTPGGAIGSLIFLNNIANELHMTSLVDIKGGGDGSGIFCQDNSIISSTNNYNNVLQFTPPTGALSCWIKPPLSKIPIKLVGTNGIVKLGTSGTSTALQAYKLLQTGSTLDFNGMDLLVENAIKLSGTAQWTNVGGRTVTLECLNATSETYRFTSTGKDYIGASQWFLNIAADLEITPKYSVVFDSQITYCDASGSGMNLHAIFGSVDGGNNSPEVVFNSLVVSAGSDFLTTNLDPYLLQGSWSFADLPSAITDPLTTTFLWTKVSGPGTLAFDDNTLLQPTVTPSVGGEYVIRITADDAQDTLSDDVIIAWNLPPDVDAGVDQDASDPTGPVLATLAGVITPSHTIPPSTTSLWSMFSGPIGGIATFVDATDPLTQVSFNVGGAYILELAATDGILSASQTMVVNVNIGPTVNAGPDQSGLVEGSTVVLDGTIVDDSFPNPPGAISSLWTKTSGPGTVGFVDATATDTSATPSLPGTYVLRLTATDGVETAFDEMTVQINAKPISNAGLDADVGSDFSPALGTMAGSISDPDGTPGPLTSLWTQTSGPGIATWTDSTDPTSDVSYTESGDYVLRLTANDGLESAYDEVTITVDIGVSIVSITTNHDDGEFTSGEEFEFHVRYAGVVHVSGGIPTIGIDLDASDGLAYYESGSGTDTLVFRYVAAVGDTTADLDITGSDALELNGATIIGDDGRNARNLLPSFSASISLVEYNALTTIHDTAQSRLVTAFQEAAVAQAARIAHSVWVDRVLTGDRDGYIGELHRGRLPAVELIQERDVWDQKSLDNGTVTSTWRIRVHVGASSQTEAESHARAILYAGLIKVRDSNYFKIGGDTVNTFQGSPLGHMLETVITVENVMRRSTYETQSTGTFVPPSEGDVGGISLEIAFDVASPVAILEVDSDQALDTVSITVREEFDDPAATVTIGVDGEQGRYLAGDESDVTELDSLWSKDVNDVGPKTVKVWVNPGASSQGRIAVQVSLTNA